MIIPKSSCPWYDEYKLYFISVINVIELGIAGTLALVLLNHLSFKAGMWSGMNASLLVCFVHVLNLHKGKMPLFFFLKCSCNEMWVLSLHGIYMYLFVCKSAKCSKSHPVLVFAITKMTFELFSMETLITML